MIVSGNERFYGSNILLNLSGVEKEKKIQSLDCFVSAPRPLIESKNISKFQKGNEKYLKDEVLAEKAFEIRINKRIIGKNY